MIEKNDSAKLFFSKAYQALSDEEMESYYKTVFLNMDLPHAAKLRQDYYRHHLRHMGENVTIGFGVTVINPQNISLDDHVTIGNHCSLIARSQKGITLRDGVTLTHGVYLDTENEEGYIDVGTRVYIGTNTCLHGHKGLIIGDDSLLAQNITITPFSHIFDDLDKLIIQQGGHSRKLTIGKDCYIGMGAIVLYSGDIGDGSVIGAGSVVVQPLPPFSVAVGVPARVIRMRKKPPT